jgi:Mrp family chromosome partitioning ATPase
LLGEIPRVGEPGSLPILSDPASPSAEAYRFAANTLVARLNQLADSSGEPLKLVAFTSAVLGEGKTTSTANVALSLATTGRSVLLVDADFGDQALTRTLVGDSSGRQGLTNMVEGDADLSEVLVPITESRGHRIDLMARGTLEMTAADLFYSEAVESLFHVLKSMYEYILIDCPPILQVSYTTAVVRLADAVVTVMPHNSRVSTQRELIDRLRLIGVPPIGYIYNKAPIRAEMVERRGSMTDPLGTGARVS